MPQMMSDKNISKLKEAVDETPDVMGNHKEGLMALKASDRKLIIVPNSRKIGGSLDIDNTTKSLYPNDTRWDYAVEYDDEIFFIEVHPASTTKIDLMLSKLEWLKGWLKTKAPRIDALKAKSKPPYHWVHTGSSKITKGSKQYKQLATHKLLPVKVWNYDTL